MKLAPSSACAAALFLFSIAAAAAIAEERTTATTTATTKRDLRGKQGKGYYTPPHQGGYYTPPQSVLLTAQAAGKGQGLSKKGGDGKKGDGKKGDGKKGDGKKGDGKMGDKKGKMKKGEKAITGPSAPTLAPRPIAPPVSRPVAAPVVAPPVVVVTTPQPSVVVPPQPPTTIPIQRSCEPTTGPCVTTAEELQTLLNDSAPNAVVAICGSDAPIVTTQAVTMDQPGTTLCCATAATTTDTSCTLQSSGTDNVLDAFADSVTLQDLVFANGVAQVFFGGNVAIDGDGDHTVVGCEFRNGSASQFGGNLFVQTTGTITIEDSTFTDGVAGDSGGGVYILNAQTVSVSTSVFSGNTATGGTVGTGGGFFSNLQEVTDFGQDIILEDTRFINNSASIGGGFFVTQLGIMPSLTILNCDFEGNAARDAGGVGAIADSLDNVVLTITGANTSTDNTAPVCPDIIGFFDNSLEPVCLLASANFP